MRSGRPPLPPEIHVRSDAPRDAPLKRPSVISATLAAESHTCDRRSRIEHLTHARTAFRALITNDDHISRMYLAGFDRASVASSSHSNTLAGPSCTSISGTTAERFTTLPSGARLPFRTARPPVSLYGLSIGRITSGLQVCAAFDIFTDGLSGDGHAVQVQQILLGQLVHDCVYAACLIKILDIGRACRSQMAYIRAYAR